MIEKLNNDSTKKILKKLDIFLCYRLEFRLCGSDWRVILFIRVEI